MCIDLLVDYFINYKHTLTVIILLYIVLCQTPQESTLSGALLLGFPSLHIFGRALIEHIFRLRVEMLS